MAVGPTYSYSRVEYVIQVYRHEAKEAIRAGRRHGVTCVVCVSPGVSPRGEAAIGQ